jgi:trk system potassium uptake protein TrkH
MRNLGVDRYWLLNKVARKESAFPHIFGVLMLYMALALVFPYLVAWYYGESGRVWLYPMALTLILGLGLVLRYKAPETTRPSEGLFIVTTGWFVVVVIGAIPFVLSGMTPVDALFETMSGFTTTGSSIMVSIESWPLSILFWRSFTQWLGGAGIIMIFVTILPMLGVGGRALVKSEFSGVNVQNFSLRIQEESRKFHYIYLGLSAAQLLFLLLTGIGTYESLNVMFSTMATGGFSPHTESIGFYQNPLVEWIVIIFMFLAGTNFYLHYNTIVKRRLNTYWKSSEFRTYVMLVAASSILIYLFVWGATLNDLEGGVRTSLFQVISVMTTTGFASVDFALWSGGALLLLLIVMAIGGSVGSTAGGLKIARFMLSGDFVYSSLYKTVHPRAVFYTKMDGRPLGEEALSSLMAVVICFIGTALLATVSLTLLGMEPTVALSAAITTQSNAGPGIGVLGPFGSFASVPELGKIVLTFTMWAGRLEFLTVFVILTPVFWKELLRYKE